MKPLGVTVDKPSDKITMRHRAAPLWPETAESLDKRHDHFRPGSRAYGLT